MATFSPLWYVKMINFDTDPKCKVQPFRNHVKYCHMRHHAWYTNELSPLVTPTTTTTTTTTITTTEKEDDWSPSLSSVLYRIDQWGSPYFAVNSFGNVTVRPFGDATLPDQEIDLLKVVKKVSDLKSNGGFGLRLPLIVRFPDVLKNRIESLHAAFNVSIQLHGYSSYYQGVYPVKCNQDKYIVEDIVKFGYPYSFGLEAGSKPELLLAMSCLCKGNPNALLICNGLKDAQYISLALIARKLSLNTVIVLEHEDEVDLVIDLSHKLSIKPVIGVRAKLRTKHSGHFGSTSGEKGKFGLTTTQVLQVVKKLGSVGMMDCLQLLHFHIGSQIPSTTLLSDGVAEGMQIYCELVRLGANMKVIDIGGGLGIDYDGLKSTNSDNSVGYTLEEYAYAVVEAVQSVCNQKGVTSPVICSESGRAIVSYHSILIFEAVTSSASNSNIHPPISSLGLDLVEGLPIEAHRNYRDLLALAARGEYDRWSLYADQLKQCCIDQFKKGSIGLEQLAAIDVLCDYVNPVSTYHVNLSIFASIPDYWGIGQLFPIIPIHFLDQRPEVQGILYDLTGDSDGKIDKFIGGDSSLPLHELDSGGNGYYLGMFLGGAYEEVLGGPHNLFGGPSIVQVSWSDDGPHNFVVTEAWSGHSCGDVLRVMHHEPELMFEALMNRAEECLHHKEEDKDALAKVLNLSFNNMPYLVSGSAAFPTDDTLNSSDIED